MKHLKELEKFKKRKDSLDYQWYIDNLIQQTCLNTHKLLKITTKNSKDYTLGELKQKLINDMYEVENYSLEDIEILKILLK